MITIRKLTVVNFGSIRFFQTSFNAQIAVVETKYISEISAAIECVLCNKTVFSLPSEWVRSDTEISAVIQVGEDKYSVRSKVNISGLPSLNIQASDANGLHVTDRYTALLSHSLEQDAVESFDGADKTTPLRLCWYRNDEDYVPTGALKFNSDYIATTKTFRSCLVKYIKAFEPELINTRKKYSVAVERDGKFQVLYPGVNDGVCLSQTEERLFLYICFLNIAEFWADIEELRNLHHVKKPLVIKNFLEFLDETVEIEHLIQRTLKLNRQIIIVTLPIEKEKLNKWIGDKL